MQDDEEAERYRSPALAYQEALGAEQAARERRGSGAWRHLALTREADASSSANAPVVYGGPSLLDAETMADRLWFAGKLEGELPVGAARAAILADRAAIKAALLEEAREHDRRWGRDPANRTSGAMAGALRAFAAKLGGAS